MEKQKLQIGDVVQIDPAYDDRFGGCFMTVTEPKEWGAQGYCAAPGDKGLAYYRCEFKDMEYVGRAVWVNGSDLKEEDISDSDESASDSNGNI